MSTNLKLVLYNNTRVGELKQLRSQNKIKKRKTESYKNIWGRGRKEKKETLLKSQVGRERPTSKLKRGTNSSHWLSLSHSKTY